MNFCWNRPGFLFSAAMLACVLTLAGCGSANKPDAFNDIDFKPGGKLGQDFWQTADQQFEEGERNQHSPYQGNTYWLFPFNLYTNTLQVAPDQQSATWIDYQWNDLGTPLLLTFLPLRIAVTGYQYERGTEEPVGKHGVVAWPLYAHYFNEGDVDSNLRIKARGMPLFFSRYKIVDEVNGGNILFWNSLWTLGPAAISYDTEGSAQQASGYLGFPLMLGGVLGALLWTDAEIKPPQEKTSLSAHGPLFGSLGYFAIKQPLTETVEVPTNSGEEEAGEEKEKAMMRRIIGHSNTHSVLLGLLWNDYVERNLEGEIEKARYGPLWTGLGWYQDEDGDSGVRLLFLKIKLL